ncbi:MAG: lipopolysaccharide biosynthesis protein [Parasphingopyxis sp.]
MALPPSEQPTAVEREDVARGAGMAALARLGAVIELIAQPIYTWLFGLATYGLYIVLWSAVNIAEKLVDLSLTEALQRLVPTLDEEAVHGTVKSAFLITVLPATVIALIVTLNAETIAGWLSASPEDAARLPLAIALFAWALPLWTFVEIATSAARARRAFGPEIRLRIFWEQLARLGFAGALAGLGFTSLGLLIAHLASLLLVAILSLRILARYYDFGLLVAAPLDARLIRTLVGSGLALLPSAASRRTLNDLPPILLNLLLPGSSGAVAAGLFGIARKVASVPLIVRQAFLYVLAPLSSAQNAQDRRRIAPLYAFSARLSAALVVPIGAAIILLGSDILSLFAPGAQAALTMLVILVAGRIGEAVLGPATPIVEMTGHRILPLVNSVIGVGIWALLAWWLTPLYGPDGMAFAVSAGAVAIAVAAVVELYWSDRLHPFDTPFLRGLAIGLAGAAMLAGIGELFAPLGAPPRAVAILAALPALAWLSLRFGLAREDRAALGRAARIAKLS